MSIKSGVKTLGRLDVIIEILFDLNFNKNFRDSFGLFTFRGIVCILNVCSYSKIGSTVRPFRTLPTSRSYWDRVSCSLLYLEGCLVGGKGRLTLGRDGVLEQPFY